MKILILRFSSIGDIVLTTPVIRCLKQQIPEVQLHFATKYQFRNIIKNNPYISKYHLLNNDINDLVQQLKAEKFDLIIDLHNNLRTALIKVRLGVKSYSFNKLNFRKWLLVHLGWNVMPNIHIVDRYLATLQTLPIVNDNKGLDYFIPPADIVNIATLPVGFQEKYTAIAIGGQHSTKKLPLHKLIELCQKINDPIVLLGGKEDAPTGEQLVYSINNKNILNTCGKYSLNQSASLIEQSQQIFAHDTGLMHIAAAFHKKIYVIWGNTIPAFGMYPYQTEYINLENIDLHCRPCSKIGFDQCPKKHFKCMEDIDFYGIS